MMNQTKVLVVDDETDTEFLFTQKFKPRLQSGELQCCFASTGVDALNQIEQQPDIAVVISDLRMPQMDGLTLLAHLRERLPLACAIVVTAYSNLSDIRIAMNHGAFDFLTKPLNFNDLEITLDKAIQQHLHNKQRELLLHQKENQLQRELNILKWNLHDRYRFVELIGKSNAMQAVYDLIMNAAATSAPVLITGESGTGKELAARTIHQLSPRADQQFIPLNCGAIAETLFESELFGHRKGAFTGADANKPGIFESAHQGTLFLDEVGELSVKMQIKLLRVLDRAEYTPVGSHVTRTADVRMIAATNQNLEERIKTGAMREDFFYRLHVLEIRMPPLRERKEDLPLLIAHFLSIYGQRQTPPPLPGDVLEQLYRHSWPGNVRELEYALYRYLTTGQLTFSRPRDLQPAASSVPEIPKETTLDLRTALDQFERQYLLTVLTQQRWQRAKAAAQLGLPARTLRRKMRKYQLTP